MISIRGKIIAGNAAVLLLILSAFAVILYRNITHNALARLDSRLGQFAYGVEREITGDLDESTFPDSTDFDELRADGPRGLRYALIDSGGRVLLSTHPILDTTERKPGVGYIRIEEKTYRLLTAEIEPASKLKFTLQAAAPLDDLEAEARHLLILLSILLPASFVSTGAIAGFIIRRAFNPLNQMISKAQTISAHTIDSKLPLPRTRDEVWRLGTVFNEMLERLNAAFKSQKQFAADASHEIRTPLAIVRSEIEYAQRFIDNPEAKVSLVTALAEVDHLAKLTENLLMLAGIDAGQCIPRMRSVPLRTFIVDVVNSLQRIADAKKVIVELTGSDSTAVRADPEMLRRAVLNILDNAIKFSVPGGSVKVAIENAASTIPAVLVKIIDSGPGISHGEMQQIFKRFYRSENLRNGTGNGLGLAIARELIALHGGEICADNAPGKGAVFTIRLPREKNILRSINPLPPG